MLRLLFAFLVLFVVAAAGTMLLPGPERPALSSTPTQAATTHTDPSSEQADRNVRVVYAPSDGTVRVSPPATPAPEPVVATAVPAPVQAPVEPEADKSRIDINTASVEALDAIPGAGRIGRTIVQHRPYASIEDLLAKRVIRRSVYDRIKDQVASQ